MNVDNLCFWKEPQMSVFDLSLQNTSRQLLQRLLPVQPQVENDSFHRNNTKNILFNNCPSLKISWSYSQVKVNSRCNYCVAKQFS